MSKEYVSQTNSAVPNGTVLLGQDPSFSLFPLPMKSGGSAVEVELASGTALIGKVSLTPSATGGWNKTRKVLTNVVQSVNSSAATAFGGYYFYNPTAAEAYVQMFDVATAGAVTLGSTAPDLTFGVPAGGAANIEFANGVAFANGIQVAATTTDTGGTAPSSTIRCNFYYK